MIDISEIRKLAALARLKLASAEEAQLVKEVDSILGYVSQIKEVALEESDESRFGAAVSVNVMRDDLSPHPSGVFTEALLSAAPKREGQYVRVKKIL